MLEAKRGDILEFKGKGFLFRCLGSLLKVCEPRWDFWGWHMAVLWDMEDSGWYVLEAQAQGVNINFYTENQLKSRTRCYQWLDTVPDKKKMEEFLLSHNSKSYDVVVYFWTAAQYLFRHFWNRRIPRLLDDRFTCWELAFEFCDEMGKPIVSKYDCPMITDALKVFKKFRVW